MGPRRRKPQPKCSERVVLLMTPRMKKDLEEAAVRASTSAAEIVRAALAEHLKK